MSRAMALADRMVRDLPALLRPGDVLVVNDTRVIPAQLTARRGDARIGITLDQPRADGAWHALARNARRLHAGDELRFDGGDELRATVVERDADGGVVLAFNQRDAEFAEALRRAGALALPPYIARPAGPLPEDATTTRRSSPRTTARWRRRRRGCISRRRCSRRWSGAGCGASRSRCMSAPAPSCRCARDDIAQHRMHAERGEITPQAAAAINAARAAGGRVVAVGTTSLRLLETAAAEDGGIRPFAGDTALFIVPGYRFRAVDLLLTNFHLPRSTLFMLVCAFAGTERMRAAYAHAIAAAYRFYSYGDACLLERARSDRHSPIASPPPTAPRAPACCTPRMATCRRRPSCRSAPPARSRR